MGIIDSIMLILVIIFLVWWFISWIITKSIIRQKSTAANDLLQQLAAIDPTWNPQAIKSRVTEVFYVLRWAEKLGNIKICKGYINDDFFIEYKKVSWSFKNKAKMDAPVSQELNMADIMPGGKDFSRIWGVNPIDSFNIIDVKDFTDNTKNNFSVLLHNGIGPNYGGTCYWKFIRSGDIWMLDTMLFDTAKLRQTQSLLSLLKNASVFSERINKV